MTAQANLEQAVRAVSRFLVDEAPIGETLQRVARLARDGCGSSKAAGLTLLDQNEQPVTSVFTHDLSPDIDSAQYREGGGPCLEAFRQNKVVSVIDVREERHRWPAFADKAQEHGVLSTLSLPLSAAGEAIGALNLYASEVNGYSDVDESAAADFATQAAVVVFNSLSYWRAYELGEGLKQALQARETIGLAKGLIMASSQCDADEAFAILVRASQRENVKLREVAARIVEDRRHRLT